MTFRDLVGHAAGNLWRMKLRASLTISGVLIAIAAFVSMLSFGAGMQENVAREFDELGLFSTMQIYPQRGDDEADSTATVLDDSAVYWLAGLPGVELAYPFEDFSVHVRYDDSTKELSAQAFPAAALNTKLFSRLEAGKVFESDSAKEVLVTDAFMEEFGIDSAQMLPGEHLVVSVRVATLDSGLAKVAGNRGSELIRRLDSLSTDSLRQASYRNRALRRELGWAMNRFLDGFMNDRTEVADTLSICGVLRATRGRSRIGPVIIPIATGRKFSQSGFSGDPADLLAGVSRGGIFGGDDQATGKSYQRVTLILDSDLRHAEVSDSVKAHGLRPFSYAMEFQEILKAFMYVKMALGLIGLIALVTASLGIVNTMVMSILERKREIGLLKSLGADAVEIRKLFLVESGVIGTAGAVGGIVFGWLISRTASAIAQAVMESKGVQPMDLFAMPFWLVATAFGIGLVVSIIAGYYPSSRAAALDPVEALRAE